MTYLLDANVFIQARNMHYGFDFCPAFWEWLVAVNARGVVFSLDVVADELSDPELSEWARQRGRSFFLRRDAQMLGAIGTVQEWISSRQYSAAAIAEFNRGADVFLIAYALAHGHTVVSNEAPAPNAVKGIKIPDVCLALGIDCITTYQLLRRERARFVLDRPHTAAETGEAAR